MKMNMIDNAIGKIIGSGKKIGGKKDWDFDGIVNSKDCQPRNTMRQDTYTSGRMINQPKRQYSSTAATNLMDRFRRMKGNRTSGKLPPHYVKGKLISPRTTYYHEPARLVPNTFVGGKQVYSQKGNLIIEGKEVEKHQKAAEGIKQSDLAKQYYGGKITSRGYAKGSYRKPTADQEYRVPVTRTSPARVITYGGAAARGYKGRIRR